MRNPRVRPPKSNYITDLQVCQAYKTYNDQVDSAIFGEAKRWPLEILMEMTGVEEKYCLKAIERSARRHYIYSPTRLRVARLTGRGTALLRLGILGIENDENAC